MSSDEEGVSVADGATLRRGLLTRTLFEVINDNDGPVQARDAIAEIRRRLDLNGRETSRNSTGIPRFETHVRFRSSWASEIGWMANRNGWSITDAGVDAMDEFPDDQLDTELSRRHRQRQQQKASRHTGYSDPRWTTVIDALTMLERGEWTTYGDLADLTGLSAQSIGRFLGAQEIANAYRVLRANGTVAESFRWTNPDRTEDPVQILKDEGVRFDQAGHANPDQHVDKAEFWERLGDGESQLESPSQRAWLVRGASVDGRNLVPVWLAKGSVSLAAASLRLIAPPVPRGELKAMVDEDYSFKSYAAQEQKLTEFDAFCNRMRPGDHVLTTSQGKAYLGRITGEASYVKSSDDRSNLRRGAEWFNTETPVPFAELPKPLPAKLHSQSDVVELTEDIAAIEQLLANLGEPVDAAAAEPAPELRFPPVGEDLADELLIERGWLQRQADLLWHRRQLIFYGPPGTGKTFIARALARQLADPSAVKLVQFHPSYTYEDFFEGFRPRQGDDGQLAFKLEPGPFRRPVEAAQQHPSDPYILIIDEINRANLAKVFGELYFLLEYRDEAISLLYAPDRDFQLPENVFVIGTMNTTDRSIALVDAAMRRRFAFVELHPDTPPVTGLLARWLDRQDGVEYNGDAPALLEALNTRIEDRNLAIGPSYLMREEIYRQEDGLAQVWETSILPLLEEQHYGSPPEVLDHYRLDTLRKATTPHTGDST